MKSVKSPSFIDALIPVLFLVALLAVSVSIYGSDSSFGPNQIILIMSAGVASIIGLKNGLNWKQIEDAMIHGISVSMGAIFILLAVGSLIGTWLLSGTVPTLIYYGLQILNPDWFYVAACLLSAIVAMSIGSSWTTAATIGVALMGIANGIGADPAIAAGAVISGAYFGDKISPLSETTNLAPAVAGSDLFSHIRHMMWTTVPSFTITLVLFTILGFTEDRVGANVSIDSVQTIISANYHVSLFNLIPLVFLVVMALKKLPAFPSIFIGALIGALWGFIFQQELLTKIADSSLVIDQISVIWTAMFDGFSITTGDGVMDDLLSGGGMSSMLNTTWLIMTALMFGAVMEKVGLLAVFVQGILKKAKSTGSLITSTIFTAFGTNLITADQYMSIVMPGRMYKEEYERRGLDNVNLSRALEDGGTITSALIPWNTCGAYMAGVLLVSPLDYWQYAFFNLINPVMAIAFAYMGIKILKTKAA
ncbi:Na+/H+ antiporter NhaC [Psychrosphaera saromensis]|uniref:Na+/H+ antiporter NhaC n=1 Tax=Psychrosphaera saromensis TaxID=716813 RepID=A0A2S7UY55_9GAMM|nr:Na+/H+ antiporter NhaC [Psychrosphaera saromensis]PQJ54668.1 Na+/H+ antiporter NhaC [Psychrosphaera saromensis]GLQ14109.1 Na+/H+ antiporter NhaC [Psychrosphaera saromensis]